MEILLTRSVSTKASSTASHSSSSLSATRDQVTYLYRLTPGLATSSHAAACAALFGIDVSVIARADEVSSLLSKFEISKLIDVDMSSAERSALNNSEWRARRFLTWEMTGADEDDVESLTQKIKEVLLLSDV